MSRFLHVDAIYRLRNAAGKRLEEVAEMVIEAEKLPPEGRTRREVHRHIGDFTLFWTGVYPEVLRRLRSAASRDHFIDYCALPPARHPRGAGAGGAQDPLGLL